MDGIHGRNGSYRSNGTNGRNWSDGTCGRDGCDRRNGYDRFFRSYRTDGFDGNDR